MKSTYMRLRKFLQYYNTSRKKPRKGNHSNELNCRLNVFEHWLIIDFFESMTVITKYGADSDIMPPLALSKKRYQRLLKEL